MDGTWEPQKMAPLNWSMEARKMPHSGNTKRSLSDEPKNIF